MAANPLQAQQSKETSPGSLLQCGQGTPTAPTDSQTPVQSDGNITNQGTPTNNLPAQMQQQNVVLKQQSPLPQPRFPNPNVIATHPQFTHPSITPETPPIEQQAPIKMQTNPLSQHFIAAPEATVPNTPEEKIPKSLNGEGVKNSRKKLPHPQLMHRTVDSASDVNSWVT